MRKKIVAVLAAALMLFSAFGVLTGCSNKNTIVILLLANKQERTFYIEYFKELEKDEYLNPNGYKIKFTGLEEGDYYQRLNSSVQRKDVPDIFYIRPNEIFQYKNLITNLQEFADEFGDPTNPDSIANLSDIYESALDMYRYNPETGKLGNPEDDLYAFPKDLSVQQLGYNKKLLEKYQEKIKAAKYKMPWEMDFTKETYTWEQYKGMCKVIADNADTNEFACDIPSIEILARSFASDPTADNAGALINIPNGNRKEATVNSLTGDDNPIAKAIKYQAELVDCGAANYSEATYSGFTAGRVCFYGLVGSWETVAYNEYFGDDWGIMPWPTNDGKTNWYGLITSAGYVVSKKAAGMAKGETAKRIAMSFMSDAMQERMVKDEKISLPLRKSVADDFRSSANDNVYSPSTRGYYLDVISGKNGFYPAKYSTYDKAWLDKLSDALTVMWNEGKPKDGKGGALAKYNDTKWDTVKNEMQKQYDVSKNR